MTKSEDESSTSNQWGTLSTKNFCINFFTGGLASAIAVTGMAPVERAKLILQVQHTSQELIKQKLGFRNILSGIVKREGFFALWRGNWLSIMRCFPHAGLNLAFKDRYHYILVRRFNDSNLATRILRSLVAGGVAGCSTLCFVYPLDFIRTRMALLKQTLGTAGVKVKMKNFTIQELFLHTLKTEGVRGFYRGAPAAFVGVFIYRSIYFGLYDTEKFLTPLSYRNILTTFLAAEFAATMAGLMSYPLDTVRRTMMVQTVWEEPKYKNGAMVIRGIYSESGLRGFYSGAGVNVIRGTGSALLLVFYDSFQELFFGRDVYNQLDPEQKLPPPPPLTPVSSSGQPCVVKQTEAISSISSMTGAAANDPPAAGPVGSDEGKDLKMSKYKVDRRGKGIGIF